VHQSDHHLHLFQLQMDFTLDFLQLILLSLAHGQDLMIIYLPLNYLIRLYDVHPFH
jgi:hypothetical protein